jgi:hypothetical protein
LPGATPFQGASAARYAMLPMMSTLSWTLAWCQGSALPPQAMLALHLAAMFLPAFLLQHGLARRPGARLPGAAAASLMVAGALALWDADPLRALLWSALLQGTAWSLAWLALLAPRVVSTSASSATPAPPARPGRPGFPAAWLNALAVLALGVALARYGLPALAAVHAGLGLWAAASLRPQAALRPKVAPTRH